MTAIIVIMCVLAVCQTPLDRRLAAMFFSVSCGLHFLLFGTLEGFPYYFSAAVFDLVVILSIISYCRATKLSDGLIDLCLISIGLNCYGFVSWSLYISPVTYNVSFMALYLIAIFLILRKGVPTHESSTNQRHTRLRLLIDKCRVCDQA